MRRSIPATIISVIVGLIQLILVLRFAFKLFNANDGAAFVQLVYNLSRPLLMPFAAIFPNIELNNGFTVELSTIVAIIVYGIVGMLLKRLFTVKREPEYRERETVVREEPAYRDRDTVIREEPEYRDRDTVIRDADGNTYVKEEPVRREKTVYRD